MTALVLIPTALLYVWFGGWLACGGAALVLLVGIWELCDMFARCGWHPMVFLSSALGLDFLLAAMLPHVRIPLFAAGVSATVAASLAYAMLARPSIQRTIVSWALTLAIPFYLGWPLALLVVLRGPIAGYQTRGFWWLMVLLGTVWANDSAALFIGHALGRHKLAPHISANKTWEGVAGGVGAAMTAAVAITTLADLLLPPPLRLRLPWSHTLVLGMLIAVAGTLGDLSKSLLKRGTGVKDSGSIFPGHGGMLDRTDSLLFAVYVIYFYALAFGLIG